MAKRLPDLLLATFVLAHLVAAFFLSASASGVAIAGRHLPGLCLVHAGTGLLCPFCGMTKSFVHLAHGHVEASFHAHPGGPILFVAMALVVLAAFVVNLRGTAPLWRRPRFHTLAQVTALGCAALGLIRGL